METVANLQELVHLKLAMRLALEFLRDLPEDMREDYMISPKHEKVTYQDAIDAVAYITDSI